MRSGFVRSTRCSRMVPVGMIVRLSIRRCLERVGLRPRHGGADGCIMTPNDLAVQRRRRAPSAASAGSAEPQTRCRRLTSLEHYPWVPTFDVEQHLMEPSNLIDEAHLARRMLHRKEADPSRAIWSYLPNVLR